MKRSPFCLAAAALLLCASSLYASSAHTWVAYFGSDSNSGSFDSPYADFATAVANTSAGGIVSVLYPGDYGAVTISQSITIDGTGGGSIAFTGSEGIFVNVSANATVVLRNLTINGVGQGTDAIFFQSSGSSVTLNAVIDGCKLEGFTDIGVGVGSEGPMNVTVRNTTIVGGELGVRTFQSAGAVPYDQVSIEHSTIQGTLGGSTSYAAVFTRNGTLEISDSVVTQNGTGLQADTAATINAQRTSVNQNTTGICAYTTSTIGLRNTDLLDDTTANENCGGTVLGSVSGGGPPANAGSANPVREVPPDPHPVHAHLPLRK